MRLHRIAVLMWFAIGTLSWCGAADAGRKRDLRSLDDIEHRITAAWDAGDDAAIVRVFDEFPETSGYGDVRGCLWRLAIALEHAGRYDAARDFYARLADRGGDPDALWGLRRCVLAMGPGKAAAQARALGKERPKLLPVLEAVLTGPHDREALTARLARGAELADQQGDDLTETALRLLRGDLDMQRGAPGAAIQSYVHVGSDHALPAVYAREASMYAALERWGDVRYTMGKLARLEGEVAFRSPPVDSLLARLEPGLAAWDRDEADRVSAGRRAAYEAAPPPQGLEWGKALHAALPMPPVEVPAKDGGVWLKWETERWRIIWNPVGPELYGWLADAGSSDVWKDREPGWFSRALPPDSLRWHWQPQHQRYRVRNLRQRPEDPFCFMLFASGDVFLGPEQFGGRGLYLSPGREPYEGICYFGLPPAVTQRVVEVLDKSEGESGVQALHLRLADSTEFGGTGVVENGVLYSVSNGWLRFPGRGLFFGKFEDGVPAHGIFKASNGNFLVFQSKRLTRHYGPRMNEGTSLLMTEDFAAGTPEMTKLANGVLEFLDGQTGWLMTYDPATGRFDERYDEARLDLYRVHQQFARLEKDREAHGAEVRAQSEAADKASAEEAALERLRSGPPSLQLYASRRNDRCIHCKGAGQIYVGSTVTQGYRYDENNKTLVDSNLHVSGHMQVCHWCNGTGKR